VKEKKAELTRINKTKKKLEAALSTHLSGYGKNLTTIPGIGTILAARILAHTNNIQRLKTQAKYTCYAGIAPRERSSGKSKRHLANTKGNRALHSIYFFAAIIQIQRNPKAKEYYERRRDPGHL
jgi:transposase